MPTRGTIETRIANELNRTDLTSHITDWFDIAYIDIQRLYDFQVMEVTIEETLVTDTAKYVLPTDIKKPVLAYAWNGTTGVLIHFYNPTSMSEIRLNRLEDPDRTGRLYAIFAGNIELWPTPGSDLNAMKLRLDAIRILAPIASGSNDWFTNYAFDYLIYRSLRESAPFLGADGRIAIWAQQEKDAQSRVAALSTDMVWSGELVMRG